jgi:hypothetical protein
MYSQPEMTEFRLDRVEVGADHAMEPFAVSLQAPYILEGIFYLSITTSMDAPLDSSSWST